MTDDLGDQARVLRHDFDRSFALPRQADTTTADDLISVRLGRDLYALRVGELAGLFADRTIVHLPGRNSELLGVAGFRGAIVPVFDLGALLGYPMTTQPRWLVIAASHPMALAFAGFDGHCRISRDAITPHATSAAMSPHVREVISVGGEVRPLISIASVVEVVLKRAPPRAVTRE